MSTARKRFWLRFRSAITGRFISAWEALRNKATSVAERVRRS